MTVDITSEADLNNELATLLRRAHREGLDVRGGWECAGEETLVWDVVVTEARQEGSE